MAEKRDTSKSVYRIKALGPTYESNHAEVLRYQTDKRKKPLEIREGQILTVGTDISEEEADRLQNLSIWKFERVRE